MIDLLEHPSTAPPEVAHLGDVLSKTTQHDLGSIIPSEVGLDLHSREWPDPVAPETQAPRDNRADCKDWRQIWVVDSVGSVRPLFAWQVAALGALPSKATIRAEALADLAAYRKRTGSLGSDGITQSDEFLHVRRSRIPGVPDTRVFLSAQGKRRRDHEQTGGGFRDDMATRVNVFQTDFLQ